MWGPFSVDNFAYHHNTQLPIFHSKCWCPGTSAVDTFSTSWEGGLNWLVPPIHLVCRALRHASVCRAKGAILLPAWRSAMFWPMIAPDGAHLADFIHSWCYLPYCQGMINRGYSGSSIEDGMSSNSAILALYFDFLVPPRSPFWHSAFKLC